MCAGLSPYNDTPGVTHRGGRQCALADRFADQAQRAAGAGGHTQATSNAAISVQSDAISCFSESLHLTAFHAGPAPLASIWFQLGDERAGDGFGRFGMALQPVQNAATTATTAADEHTVLGIAGLQHQIGRIGPCEDGHNFILVNGAPPATPYVVVGKLAKYQAALLRRIAPPTGHFRPAAANT